MPFRPMTQEGMSRRELDPPLWWVSLKALCATRCLRILGCVRVFPHRVEEQRRW